MTKDKSRNFPYLNLEVSIDTIKSIRKLGKKVSRTTLAEHLPKERSDSTGDGAISLKSSTVKRKIGALSQYALITASKDEIEFTNRADAFYAPKDNEEDQLVKETFLTPPAFSDLYNQVEKNQEIKTQHLKSLALRDLGISTTSINKFMENFVKSAYFANLLEFAGEDKSTVIFKNISNNLAPSDKIENNEAEPPKQSYINNTSEVHKSNNQTATLKLSCGVATIAVPEKLSQQDKARLKSQIDVFVVSEI